MTDCLFCRIVKGSLPCDFIYEDDCVLAFNDIMPQAPVHVLIIPKQHINSLTDVSDDIDILAHIHKVVQILIKQLKVDPSGFRLVVNTGIDGGQTVPHLHFHLLAGRKMQWPPG
jgi:histidine triad (HIT) family protein